MRRGRSGGAATSFICILLGLKLTVVLQYESYLFVHRVVGTMRRWCDDRRAVAPAARAVFYAGLLLMLHTEKPLLTALRTGSSLQPSAESWLPFFEARPSLYREASDLWCRSPAELLCLDGLKGLVDGLLRIVFGWRPESCAAGMEAVGTGTSLALLAAAACSLLRRRPSHAAPRAACRAAPALAAAGMLLHDAIHQMVHESSHRWILVALCTVVLALDDATSPSYEARRACTDAAASIQAAACASKLLGSRLDRMPSLEWAAGETLSWAFNRRGSKFADTLRGAGLSSAAPLAILTLAMEAGGLMVLVCPVRLRAPLCTVMALVWGGFHAAVLVFLRPTNYLPSALAYATLVVPWASVGTGTGTAAKADGGATGERYRARGPWALAMPRAGMSRSSDLLRFHAR